MLADNGQEEAGLDQLARVGFHTLGLQSYLTAGPKESRAWTIHRGWTAPQAAGVIHTDFQKGFIKAEVISFDDLVAAGSVAAARAAGKARIEGKDYVMADGDVVEFRFTFATPSGEPERRAGEPPSIVPACPGSAGDFPRAAPRAGPGRCGRRTLADMTQTEDLDSVERLYATLDTSALLALLPLIDTLSERVREEIERIGGPITSVSEAQQHAALFESVTAGLTGLANQWPGSDAFEEMQAQVDADKANLQARADSARAFEAEARTGRSCTRSACTSADSVAIFESSVAASCRRGSAPRDGVEFR